MPRFQAGGGSDAMLQFLMQREMENRQRMLDEATAERDRADEEERRRRTDMADREYRDRTTRQSRIDTQAEDDRQTAKRAEQNTIGVRGMMADAMTQGPLTQDSRNTIGIMALREGMDVPPQVQQAQASEDEARTRSQGLADYESRKMIDASVDQQNHGDPWRSAGTGSIFHAGTGEFRNAPVERGGGSGGGGADSGPSAYALETAQRTIQAIDDVLPKINSTTAGAGSLLKMVPGSDAANVSAELSSVAANVAFNALQAMRDASKTGGALGQVSERELDLLSAVEGSIRQNQSPENLKANLGKIRESMARFQAAAQQLGGGAGGRAKWGRDAQGRPVRLN